MSSSISSSTVVRGRGYNSFIYGAWSRNTLQIR